MKQQITIARFNYIQGGSSLTIEGYWEVVVRVGKRTYRCLSTKLYDALMKVVRQILETEL